MTKKTDFEKFTTQCNCEHTHKCKPPDEVEVYELANEYMCEMFIKHKKLEANHNKLNKNQLDSLENVL